MFFYQHIRATAAIGEWAKTSGFWAISILLLLGGVNCFGGEKLVRIAMVGDSTMEDYSNVKESDIKQVGWGQAFSNLLRGEVEISNFARSGVSSKTFIQKGYWGETLKRNYDYIFIQFGHNDLPVKGYRSTNPKSDFKLYLRKYIVDSRRLGAIPILFTPTTRRNFKHGKIHTALGAYAMSAKEIARELKVQVIDLHGISIDLYNSLGESGSKCFAPSSADRTHFSEVGANAIALKAIDELQDYIPELKGKVDQKNYFTKCLSL